MSLEAALRLTEVLLALALIQQSAEHLAEARGRALYTLRLGLAIALGLGLATPAVLAALCVIAIRLLHRWQGPYNGGADRMGLLILFCLTAARLVPAWAEPALGYLGMQLILSYVISGWVKVVNPDWRRGRALAEVFRFSAYPVAEDLRGLARRPRLILAASWAVMGLELAFPLAFLTAPGLRLALVATAAFHLSNALMFGLNRFLWTWLAAYPALLWLQARLLG